MLCGYTCEGVQERERGEYKIILTPDTTLTVLIWYYAKSEKSHRVSKLGFFNPNRSL